MTCFWNEKSQTEELRETQEALAEKLKTDPRIVNLIDEAGKELKHASPNIYPACGASISSKAKFCSECGAPLARKCSSCGTELKTGMKFCPECGAKV